MRRGTFWCSVLLFVHVRKKDEDFKESGITWLSVLIFRSLTSHHRYVASNATNRATSFLGVGRSVERVDVGCDKRNRRERHVSGCKFRGYCRVHSDVSGWNVSKATNLVLHVCIADRSTRMCQTGMFQTPRRWLPCLRLRCFLFGRFALELVQCNLFERLFMRCRIFHSDVSQSNVANATNMFNRFGACTAFNSNASQWNVTLVAARVHRAAPGELGRTPYCMFSGM
jgi:hypothetical protein